MIGGSYHGIDNDSRSTPWRISPHVSSKKRSKHNEDADGVVGDRAFDHAAAVYATTTGHDDVFASPELLLNIVRMIADGNRVQSITNLSLVSKNFYIATISDRLWREMCYLRWKGKWGFHRRWENALIDSGECQHTCSSTYPKCEDGKFWQSRYRAEEDGAAKQKITADELENLVFDFRFWMGEPTILGDEHIKFKSGLVDSASREFRFLRNARERQERWSAEGPFWNAKGHVVGHPSQETGIECK